MSCYTDGMTQTPDPQPNRPGPSGRIDTTIIKTEMVGTMRSNKTMRTIAIERAFAKARTWDVTGYQLIGVWPTHERGDHGGPVWAVEIATDEP
jgi:hypothetical protein